MIWKLDLNANLQVNRIRELPQNSKIVATHTDSPHVSNLGVSTQFRFLLISWVCRSLSYNSLKIRSLFGMLKLNLTVMLSLELQTLVQIWYGCMADY